MNKCGSLRVVIVASLAKFSCDRLGKIMRYYKFLDEDMVTAEFKALGFESPEEATRFRTVDQLYQHLGQQTEGTEEAERDQDIFKNLPQRYRQAKHLATKLERAGRDLVGLNDPATASLRHFKPAASTPSSGATKVRMDRGG